MSFKYYIVKVRLSPGGQWRTCGLNYYEEKVPMTDGYHEIKESAKIFADKIRRERKDLHDVAVFYGSRLYYRPTPKK